jgi:MFS family permease
MAGLWCLATIACGFSQSYGHLMLAAQGSGSARPGTEAPAAHPAHVFPPDGVRWRSASWLRRRSSAWWPAWWSAVRCASHGWRSAFLLVGAVSLILVVLYPLIVRDYKPWRRHEIRPIKGRRGEWACSR